MLLRIAAEMTATSKVRLGSTATYYSQTNTARPPQGSAGFLSPGSAFHSKAHRRTGSQPGTYPATSTAAQAINEPPGSRHTQQVAMPTQHKWQTGNRCTSRHSNGAHLDSPGECGWARWNHEGGHVMDINFKGDLLRINPQPGDVFVLSTEKSVTAEQATHLKQWIEMALPGHKAIVLCDGMKLECIDGESLAQSK